MEKVQRIGIVSWLATQSYGHHESVSAIVGIWQRLLLMLLLRLHVEACPLIHWGVLLLVTIGPLVLVDIWQSSLLTFLRSAKGLIVHLLTVNTLCLVHSTRRWWHQQRRNTANRPVWTISLSKEERR